MKSKCCNSTKLQKIGENYTCLNVECSNYARITKRVNRYTSKFKFLLVFFVFNTFSFGFSINTNQLSLNRVKTPIIEFSKESLILEINKLNPTYLNLCLRQCQLESSMGTSPLYKETNNLFGMTVFSLKEPHVDRLAYGKIYYYKVYKTWVESLEDWYRLMIYHQDEAQLQRMSHYYFEDPNYIAKINQIK